MTSQRFPGKMMLDLHGRPVLESVVERVSLAGKISNVIVATSSDQSDDAIATWCALKKIQCFRGPIYDVAERFRQVIVQERADAFVRITGDSVLIDPALIDRAVSLFEQGEWDLVTNVLPRTFPKGQSVEVLLSETLIRTCATITTPEQREHVTRAYYENPLAFRIVSFTSGMDLNHLNLSVDTPDDLNRIAAVVRRTGNNPGGWRQLASIYESL